MLEATRRILVREGPRALTTTRIAEVAGVSIGSLYQYFADKEEILAALARETGQRMRVTIVAALERSRGEPLAVVCRVVVEAMAAQVCSEGIGLHRVLHDALGGAERTAMLEEHAAAVAALLEPMLGLSATDADTLAGRLVYAGDGLSRLLLGVADSTDLRVEETVTVLNGVMESLTRHAGA
jgi:AcrR family transcriptional regulator